MAPTYVGDFHLAGADLRRRGLNRIGNMLVPNSNYCKFEDWVVPVLDAMLAEQQAAAKAAAAKGEEAAAHWTPSRVRAAGAWRGVVGFGMRMLLAAAPLPAADSSHAACCS
jgi:deoxyhypusine synthase